MADAMLEVTGLVNRFGPQVVHEGLDMHVAAGEVFGIVGGSGTGKSVLLRTILGLRRPQAGCVRLHGEDITQMSARELRQAKAAYGVTFQEGALYSSLTVRENIQLPMVEHLNDDQVTEFARHNVRKSDSGMYVWKMDGAIRTTPAAPPSMDQWEALKAMTCPVLVLRGAKSDVLSADIARRMMEALPDGKLVEVPGVGHAPVLTEPEAKAALDEFLGAQAGATISTSGK